MNRIKNRLIKTYEKIYPSLRWRKFFKNYKFTVMDSLETIEYIKKTKCSIARYGDGEFGIILKSNNPDFQMPDSRLAERLKEIAAYDGKDVLICIPHNFAGIDDCNEFAWKFWNWWLWDKDNLINCAKILNLNAKTIRSFGDAQLTRPYMDWKDKSKSGDIFNALKGLWSNKRVLLIEGSETKMGVNNDLLSGTAEVVRLICPASNAFSKYDEILDTSIEIMQKNNSIELIIICLGPAATVLAYDLGRKGYQALDIGHLDIEYEWFLKKAETKVQVSGKHTQEAHQITEHLFDDDQEYQSQILFRIQ